MLALLKIGWGIFARYRFWVTVIAAVAALTTVLVFYGNCRANSVELQNATKTNNDLQIDLSAARGELVARNARIHEMNEARIRDLEEAKAVLKAAMEAAAVLRKERDKVKRELEITRTHMLEALRDDKEFALWASGDVPNTAWSLLQSAAQGR